MSDEKTNKGNFSDFEVEAMRDRAKEIKAEQKAAKNRDAGLQMITDAIALMSTKDKAMAEQIHAIVTKAAPELMPKTWYGMPAYADKDGKAVVFFQPADKFKARYSTLGFNDNAKLDEGNMWPASFGIIEISSDVEARITELVKKAIR